jgi:hypothetical protein
MTEATLIQQTKLTRLPFTDFPQAPDNEPSTKPALLGDQVALNEGGATKTNKHYVLTCCCAAPPPKHQETLR